jgi:hypothetical protein
MGRKLFRWRHPGEAPHTVGAAVVEKRVMKGRPHAVGKERTEGGRDGAREWREGARQDVGVGMYVHVRECMHVPVLVVRVRACVCSPFHKPRLFAHWYCYLFLHIWIDSHIDMFGSGLMYLSI